MPKRKVRREESGPASAAAGGSQSRPTNGGGGGGGISKPSSVVSGNNLIAPNTRLGQHFLKNPAVVNAIVAKAGLNATDVVLEVGPGTGNMTLPLLDRCQKVVAVEYDPRMIREVLKRVDGTPHASKLTVLRGDVIKTALPFFDVCVANIPYQISSALIFKLLAHRPSFRCAVIMLQEEFALRLTARPGEALYCRLSVNAQLLSKIDQLLKVGKNNFRPPPKVESRVVRIEPRRPPPPINFVEWDGMLRLLFNRKNKTLRSVLNTRCTLKLLEDNRKTVQALASKGDVHMEGNDDSDSKMPSVAQIIEDVTSLPRWEGKRASKLDLDDFMALLAEFNERGIHFA